MFRLCAKIEISGDGKRWTFAHVTEVEITRDVDKLTDECKLVLPKRIKWDGEAKSPIRRGMQVRVWLGYDHPDRLELAFVGYVREVGFKAPIELLCEDEMFVLKQKPAVKKAYRKASIAQVLSDQNIGYPIKVLGEQGLGAYRVTADTVSALLATLGEQGIKCFFRLEGEKPVLYAGVVFERSATISQTFATAINLIDSNSLKQQRAEDMRIKVKAVSIQSNGKKKRVEVGDPQGEVRTLHTYGKSEAELKAWAEQEVKRLKRDGLTGSFTTFGIRLVDKLDNVALRIDGKRMGVYQVKKNVIKYGTSGYHQEITLGQPVLLNKD